MNKHEIYRDAELAGRVGFGDHPAVLVVDFQNAFTDPSIPGGGDFAGAIEETLRVLEVARTIGVPRIFTVVEYQPHLRDAGRFIEKCPTLRYAVAGSELVELDARLAWQADEYLIQKKFASAFFSTALGSILTAECVDTLVVCGCTTSGCVRATVVDALQNGFRAIVPTSCVADIAEEPHEASLFDIDAKYGDVVDLDEVIAYLRSVADGNQSPSHERPD